MKNVFIIIAIFIFYIFVGDLFKEKVIIPNEAIRLRVIANSDSENDQKVKNNVSIVLQKELYDLLKKTNNANEARYIIDNNLSKINQIVKKTLNNDDYKINFGNNYFPSKTYKGVVYKEGYYESLLVTLGSGNGQNWWCVLFPPLCLMEAEENSELEYKIYVKELIEKYF